MMKEQTPRTPASGRSVVRNHSPYCESTGPIVQEGFVAARVRALQGFSNQAQIETRSLSPFTPCPPRKLHAYKLRSSPRSTLAPNSALTGAEILRIGSVKQFRTEILSRDYRNLASASEGSARTSTRALFFQPQEPQRSFGPAKPSRSPIGERGAGIPCSNLFTGTVPSRPAQRSQEDIRAPSVPLSEVDSSSNVPMQTSSLSEKAILSPRALQIDLVGPQATWINFPQNEDHNDDYCHQQALQPRGSIADKLVCMVEQGWTEDDPLGEGYNDNGLAAYTLKSESCPPDSGMDSRGDSVSQTHRLQKVLSLTKPQIVSAAEPRTELHHSIGRDNPPHIKQNDPRLLVPRGFQKRRQLQVKQSPAVNSKQRSNSDSGIHLLKSESASFTGGRRAWTVPYLDHWTSNQSQSQRELPTALWPRYVRDHHSSGQNSESVKSPPSDRGSISQSGFDLIKLGDERLRQDSTSLSKVNGSRRLSSNTKGLMPSASRTTSFFKRFPWYKVALVDKQPMEQDSSREGCSNYRTSRSMRPTPNDPVSSKIKLSPGATKSHTVVERGYEEDTAMKTRTPQHQGSIGQQSPDFVTSYYEASSQPIIQRTKSPEKTNARRVLEQIRRGPERPQDAHAIGEDNAKVGNLYQLTTKMIERAQSPSGTGLSARLPEVTSHSETTVTNLESPVSDYHSQSFQPPWPEVKEYPRMQSFDSSYAKSIELQANDRYEQGSCDSGRARLEPDFTARTKPSEQLGSKISNLPPERLVAWTDSLPASGHRRGHDKPVRREVKGTANGIKKIQVTVTFDGAEDLVVEATLKK